MRCILHYYLLHLVWFTDGDDYTEVTGPRFAHFLFFSDTSRQSCFTVEIREDNRYEFEEQFSLRFIALEGTSLPDNLVLDPPTSTIIIRGAPFGGCYSNSACSGQSLRPLNAEECCVSSAGTYFSDETTCFQCIGTFLKRVYMCFEQNAYKYTKIIASNHSLIIDRTNSGVQ